ncbi:ArnT family glycosyltransferase [Butyrivibrio sp. LC3010]|uniref:ArnT family glycosyltransferase n=1 Tax=Butyrivibrio sp. LC3010 TaxID=1280680 RepID=UPI000479FF71|nr:glycosyltransferase family 39 protein [Butyrivibrio sp. LC3010]
MKKGYRSMFWVCLMVVFVFIDAYMIFHNLGKGYLIQTDEAYHATNAYEMFKQGNWMINTYRYAADYFNSKPPISLDAMILSFKIFGVSSFAVRFPSALMGIMTCLLIIGFFFYTKDSYAGVFFSVLFGACTPFFTFHMYRAAEMDALYNLFFTISMFSLYLMSYRYSFMYLYAISMGMAFMCKGPHAALIFIIGLLYIPKIRNSFGFIKRVVVSVILAAMLPIMWMIKRYFFDGFEFLNALFVGEVADRVSSADSSFLEPLNDFFTSNIVMIFAVALLFIVIGLIVKRDKANSEKLMSLRVFVSENSLFLLWTIVPVAFFSLTRSYLTWYTYTSQIAMCILTAKLISFFINDICSEQLISTVVISGVVVAMCIYFMIPTIRTINLAGTGGHPVDQFVEDVQDFAAVNGKSYAGKNAYLISDFRINKAVSDHWEPEYVAPAEMYLDVIPVDGTVENFLSDPDSILIIDKDLWEDYADVLTGHVILHDNSYLIFSNEMY